MDKNTPIIEVRNIGKKYNIAHMKGGYVALRDVVANVLQSPFSFLKGKAEQVAGLEKKEEFWALKDISFNVGRGEVVGVIGANGAGKSTLLKILTQITPPTEGEVVLRGRVGSLLEVGTGFHPELTGRENIFLNGAILGMKKKEIQNRFDEIVAFSGVEKFLDTPVKFYSSGMYVRLAFSVAAHMEPDILLVDEVLAVGDAEFQKKCLGKMDEITKKDGRTILFVSHNMSAIQQICTKCVFLKDGRIESIGEPQEIVNQYLSSTQRSTIKIKENPNKQKEAKLLSIVIKDNEGKPSHNLLADQPFYIETEYELKQDLPAYVILKISNRAVSSSHLLVSLSHDNNQKIPPGPGKYRATVKVDPVFNAGTYSILVGVTTDSRHYLDYTFEHNIINISSEGKFAFPTEISYRDSVISLPFEWKTEKL